MPDETPIPPPAGAEIERVDREIREDLLNARNMANMIYLETLAEIKELENDLMENVLPLVRQGGVDADHIRASLKSLFNFALGRNVAFESLMKTIGGQFHREIAISIERNFPHDLEKFYEFLILHWGEAGAYAKAVGYCVRAAEAARRAVNPERAVALCNRGLDLLRVAQESESVRQDARELATVLYQTGLLHQAKGDHKAAIVSFEDARRQFTAVGDQNSLATCLSSMGMSYRALKDLDHALQAHRLALELRTKLGEMKKAVISLNNIGIVYGTRGQAERALEELRQAESIAGEIHDDEGLAITRGNIAVVERHRAAAGR